jgi:hypothetical protein
MAALEPIMVIISFSFYQAYSWLEKIILDLETFPQGIRGIISLRRLLILELLYILKGYSSSPEANILSSRLNTLIA